MHKIDGRQTFRTPAVLRSLESFRLGGCVVETCNRHFSSGRTYTRCRIVNESPDLPDGAYRVEFSGHSIRINKVAGEWEWELVFLHRLRTRKATAQITGPERQHEHNGRVAHGPSTHLNM